jgi:adenylate cyclase
MNQEEFKRKLTAVMSADVVGYSRLMGEDEADTVQTLNVYKEIMFTLIKQHRGRVIDSPGDNLLAEFASVVDAVQCGVAVQKELQARNAERPENRRMEFRIGINLGDVIEEEDRIFGDGVNIAARLEALADAGGICISKTAFDQIETKLPLGYEYLGEKEVKNIAKPVGAFRVLMDAEAAGKVIGELKPKPKQLRWAVVGALAVLIIGVGAWAIWNFYFRPAFEPASVERMAFPLPDKPSIAVLPFANMSEDPRQKYFCDGLTEEIITALSKVPRLFVIARNSTFSYKGKMVKVQQVAEDLGVGYVLEGSVRKAGDQLRITAQLIDALTGHHLWAERYDRDLRDIFALQDEITMKIITALEVELTEGEQARVYAKGTDNLQAYLKLLEGREHVRRQTREDNILARRMAKEAIAMDPEYPNPYELLANTHMMDVWLKTTKSPEQSMRRAIELAQKAIALDDSLADAHGLLSLLYTMLGQHDKGIAEGKRAVALDPNGANSHAWLSTALRYDGSHEEALQAAEKALRLNPFPPEYYFFRTAAAAYIFTGRYEEAIAACKNGLNRAPNDVSTQIYLTAAYSLSGREKDARAKAEEVLRIDPKFSLKHYATTWPYKNQVDRDLIMNALRRAGLPETPPLPLPDKPSIAVLPFVNMSGDPEQEYFSDGITEEIITALSKIPKLFVIARTSSFKYKGKEVDVRTVGRELGVRHVLEGSVRRASDKVRITAQLVDGKTGNHVWAERYDRDLKDIFAVQDEITKKIITALQVELTEGEQALIYGRGTNNLEAYLKVLRAAQVGRRLNQEDNLKARRMAEEAIALDPNYASAYRELGATHLREVWLRITKSPRDSLRRAAELAKKALALDESLPPAHTLLGQVYLLSRAFDKAIAEGQRVIEIDPNGAESHWFLGMALTFAGRPEEAIQSLEKAIRLNPFAPSHYLHIRALSHWYLGQYEEAIEWGEKAVKRTPKDQLSHLVLTMSYSSAGREEEARAQGAKVLKINPKYCVRRGGVDRFKDPGVNERFKNALRKAGVPDCPPRPGTR